MPQWSDLFGESALRDLDLRAVVLNLGLVLLLGQMLTWHYLKFCPVLSNKRKFSRLFVFISATTMLVITVVKTSLALSLGLVGALSIIRFRTPIKEPEELAYLFLAVGLGIGLGADQRLITSVVFLGILLYLALTGLRSMDRPDMRMLVQVTSSLLSADKQSQGAERTLAALLTEIEGGASQVDLRRVDVQGGTLNATLLMEIQDPGGVGALLSRIQDALPDAGVSVLEGSSLD